MKVQYYLFILFYFHFAFVSAQLTRKEIKQNFVAINETVFAGKFEVTNVDYRRFLNDIKSKVDESHFQTLKIDSTQWINEEIYREKYVKFYHIHPAFDLNPVVNISRAAAEAYCGWLTSTYQSNPKRTYQRVLFRLPTTTEWQQAAHGSDSVSNYPWEGDFFFTKKMHHRCNVVNYYEQLLYVPFEEKYTEDIFTTKSFEANSIGLYNMGGNVSEMVSDANITKGGSWLDDSYFTQIAISKTYDLEPHPSVGFRVFMEIIEP